MASFSPPSDLRFQITGHETFPLRQLWLSKLTRYINDTLREKRPIAESNSENLMVELGVGKNMVSSIRFWAQACGMVDSATLTLTPLGELIFGTPTSRGLDECSASATTQWLVHWRLAATPAPFIPIFYLFNLVSAPSLDRDNFLSGLVEFCRSSGNKTSVASIKRAVEVCLRSYAPRMTGKGHAEDFIEPFLGELNLLDALSREAFAFRRASHPGLHDALFAFALMEYWERLPYQASSLDFSRIAHDYGSPGKVFKLDMDSINERLYRLSELTNESLIWTEQAGLKQVVRRGLALENPKAFKIQLLKAAYA